MKYISNKYVQIFEKGFDRILKLKEFFIYFLFNK